MTWILAQTGGGEAPSTITSEPVGSEDVETMTKEAADPNGGAGSGPKRGPFGDFWTIGLIAIMMIVVFTFFRGPRKQKQEHRKMLQSLEKNDRVRTIGGMIGTVVEIKGDEVRLKVDESNNTKMWFISSAIGKNLSKDTK